MKTIIADLMKLEAIVNKINAATNDDQTKDPALREAVSSLYDSLDMLKDRAGLGDDGWRVAA